MITRIVHLEAAECRGAVASDQKADTGTVGEQRAPGEVMGQHWSVFSSVMFSRTPPDTFPANGESDLSQAHCMD